MDSVDSPPAEHGWTEDPAVPPHLVLSGAIGGTSSGSLVTVEGRAVLVLPASDHGDSGLLRAVDVATGTVLPDRSLLRHGRHEVLAVGGGRLLATLGPHRTTVVVRDAVTGSPVGVPIREEQQTRSLALTMVDGRPAVVTTGSGLAVRDVQTGALIGRHERIRGRHFVTYQGRLFLVAEQSARSLQLYDVLTGEPLGSPLPCDFCLSVYRLSAVDHDGRLLVAFLDSHTDTKVSLWDVTAGVELPSVPPAGDVRGISMALVGGRPLLLVGRSGPSGSLTLWDPVAGRPVLTDCFAGSRGDWTSLALDSLDDGFSAVTVSGSAADLWVWSPAGMRRTSLAGSGVWRTATGTVDGRPTVAVGGSYGDLRLFDVRTGQEFSSPFYGGPVAGVIGGTDRAGRAAVLLSGRPLRWWDVTAGVPVARLDRSVDGVTHRAAGELNGRMVVAFVTDARGTAAGLTVWDPETGALLAEVSLEPADAGDARPQGVTFTEIDGRTAVAVAIGRTVCFWDAATGEPLGRPYQGSWQSVAEMTGGRIGDRPVIAVGGRDERVHVFDPAAGKAVVPPISGHSGFLTALSLGTADGRAVVAAGSWDNTVRVWDAATGACIGGPWRGHGERITVVRVTEWNGEPVVLSQAATGPPRLWRLHAPAPENGHTGSVRAVAAGRWNGRPVFASGGDDRTVRLWDAANGRSLGPALTDHAATVTHVAFTGPNRDILVTADDSGVVLRWQPHAGAPRSEPLASPGNRITGLSTAEMAGRPLVCVGTADGTIHIWDAVTSEVRAELPTGPGVAVGRTDLGVLDGRLVALTIAAGGSDDGSVLTLWDVAAGAPLHPPMTVPEESANLGAFVELDGRLVVVQGIDADADGHSYRPEDAADVQLIDVATRTVLRRYRQKRGWSHHAIVARSAAGTVVLVASEEQIAVVDPYETGGPDVQEFEYGGHRAFVTCLAAAEVDGRTIVASGDRSSALHLWDLTTGERLPAVSSSDAARAGEQVRRDDTSGSDRSEPQR